MSQKVENILNLALEATPEERARSGELDVGYDPEEQERYEGKERELYEGEAEIYEDDGFSESIYSIPPDNGLALAR